MKSIYKYPLLPIRNQDVEIPKGAKILSVQNQRDNPVLYAIVDTDNLNELESRRIVTFPTGAEIDNYHFLQYISTVMLYGEDIVIHFFEQIADNQ